jgi:hypothetical protein
MVMVSIRKVSRVLLDLSEYGEPELLRVVLNHFIDSPPQYENTTADHDLEQDKATHLAKKIIELLDE